MPLFYKRVNKTAHTHQLQRTCGKMPSLWVFKDKELDSVTAAMGCCPDFPFRTEALTVSAAESSGSWLLGSLSGNWQPNCVLSFVRPALYSISQSSDWSICVCGSEDRDWWLEAWSPDIGWRESSFQLGAAKAFVVTASQLSISSGLGAVYHKASSRGHCMQISSSEPVCQGTQPKKMKTPT